MSTKPDGVSAMSDELGLLVERAGLLACVDEEYMKRGDWAPIVKAFADAVQAAERERCAKLCESLRDNHIAGTRSAENPGDWCAENGADCEFVAAWNEAAAAIRCA